MELKKQDNIDEEEFDDEEELEDEDQPKTKMSKSENLNDEYDEENFGERVLDLEEDI